MVALLVLVDGTLLLILVLLLLLLLDPLPGFTVAVVELFLLAVLVVAVLTAFVLVLTAEVDATVTGFCVATLDDGWLMNMSADTASAGDDIDTDTGTGIDTS